MLHPAMETSPALCAESNDTDFEYGYLALCAVDVDPDTNEPPEWIKLLPAGKHAELLDGRRFKNPNPEAIVERFNKDPRDLAIDWEHSTEIKAPKGEKSPASGWGQKMEMRNGAVWMQVKWTARGAADLSTKEYRYISPAFIHNRKREILGIVSAGLTNKPAMHLQVAAARNQDDADVALAQEDSMDPKLLALLGLKVDATPEEVMDAVTVLKNEKAKTAQTLDETKVELETARAKGLDVTKFIPRDDFDAMSQRALAAEQKVADVETETAKAAADAFAVTVTTEVDAACKAGKFPPASKPFYVSTCSNMEGLEKFRAFVKDAPIIAADTDLDGKKPEGAGGDEGDRTKLTEDEIAIATACGRTAEQHLAYLKDNA